MTMLEQNMKVYIVEVITKVPNGYTSKLSQEGYKTLSEAKKFITSRSFDTIVRINDFYYTIQLEQEVTDYKIHEIIIE